MTYVDKNLVPGETLLYQTRHHWIVLLLPVLVGLLLSVPGAYLLMRAFMLRSGPGAWSLFDAGGNIIGMVLVSVRWLMDRDGELRITWPDGHISRDAPSAVLPAAA